MVLFEQFLEGLTNRNARDDRSRGKRHVVPKFGMRLAEVSLATVMEAIDLILQLDRVEHEAKAQEIVGTKQHLRLRRARAGPFRDTLHEWLLREKSKHPPRA